MAALPSSKTFVLVVGIDFGEESERALGVALNLARRSAPSAIHAVHVLPLHPEAGLADLPIATRIEEARNTLRSMIGRLGIEGQIGVHVTCGEPIDVLADLALDLHADVVVLGTHGRRGVSRFVFGSVAESVVRRAPCSVLVVRDRQLSPEERIEPPCPDCLAVAKSTGDPRSYCPRHEAHHVRGHRYSEAPISQEFAMGSLTFRTPDA